MRRSSTKPRGQLCTSPTACSGSLGGFTTCRLSVIGCGMAKGKITPLPPVSTLAQRLVYDPFTGVLRWRTSNGRRAIAGKETGCRRPNGYVFVTLDGHDYAAHRIAWALFYGEDPLDELDHENLDRSDNRIGNLRKGKSWQQHCYNRKVRADSSSGIKGVYAVRGRWRATITENGKRRHLGYFDNKEDAADAYRVVAIRLHGQFYRE